MRRPQPGTMVVGHPVIAIPMMLLCGFILFLACQDGQAGIGVFMVMLLAALGKAKKDADAYRAWEREWNAMAPGAPTRTKHNPTALGTWVIGAGLSVAYWRGDTDTRTLVEAIAFVFGGLAFVVLLLRFIVTRWKRRRRKSTQAFAVKVVARPIMKTCPVADAYRALPPYCDALLRGRQ